MQVDTLANQISAPRKSPFLANIFKEGLKKKFKDIKSGFITISDMDESFSFGDVNSINKVSLAIFE